MKMNKVNLGEVIDVKRGASLAGKYYSTNGDYIRLTLGNFNYPGGGFKKNSSKADIYYVGPIRDEFILKKGDIITPLTEQVAGLLGETARIPEENLYIQSGDVGKVIPLEGKIDNSFAYYLLSSPAIKKQLGVAAQQTKIRHTSPEKIKDCIAWIPESIDYQHFAGEILDNINDIIENNTKIISELESLAKTIYDYWFLQFDYPDENGHPYRSSGGKMIWNKELKKEIPEGWEVTYVKDYLNVVTGKEDANHSAINGKYPFFTCSNEILRSNDYKFDGKAILIAGNGDFNVKYFEGRFNAYQRTYVLIPKDELYTGIIYQNTIQTINRFKTAANGSIVKFITKSDVEDIIILRPQNLDLFNPFNTILTQIEQIKNENHELASLRDFLLPLLMNGQVKIKE